MSKHLTPRQIFMYAFPTIIMMLFSSIYDIVDGLFVSVYAGVTAFAALDLVMPYLLILGSLGFMVGAGANAVIARALSKNDPEEANGLFSFFIYALFIFGLIAFCLAQLYLEPVCILFGAEPGSELLAQCVLFGRLSLISLPAFMLQYAFQSLFATAGKPGVGMVIIVTSGLINVLCDCFFVAYMGMGVAGAGISTTIAEIFGGMVPVIYFMSPFNKSSLRLGKPKIDFPCLAGVCANGSSELMTNVATSVVAIFYNLQLMRYIGESGVAAYGVIMYAGMIVAAFVMGYSVGVAPLTSYQHGRGNQEEKLHLIETSAGVVLSINVLMFILVQALTDPLAVLFTGYDQDLCELTKHAFRIYSFAFLFMGFSMYASSLFTSLGSSAISGIISFGRTLVFEVGVVMVLPLFLGAEGIWISVIVAEFCAVLVSTFFILGYSEKYEYRASFMVPFQLPGKLDHAVNKMIETLSGKANEQFDVLEDAVDDAADSLGDRFDIVGDAIDDVREAIGDGVESLGDALNTEGLDGFADSIRGDDDTFDNIADMIRGDEGEKLVETHEHLETEEAVTLKKSKTLDMLELPVMDKLGDAKRVTEKRRAKRLRRQRQRKQEAARKRLAQQKQAAYEKKAASKGGHVVVRVLDSGHVVMEANSAMRLDVNRLKFKTLESSKAFQENPTTKKQSAKKQASKKSKSKKSKN